MIDDSTAIQLLYDWHSGQWSPFYAAASSGLVESFSALIRECKEIDEPDRTELLEWIRHQEQTAPEVSINDRTYQKLPWADKT